ncbi:MAG TPA: AraC family transcriptional regulator [Candidatus Latescibacteria bacterium]|nr:AraC family transcriptional regulator [Candidatus Handelsmanbacteria bacterium]HIL09456.1 AraC family transcriptional regulator [Candidatus Latescibacterota bacterium]
MENRFPTAESAQDPLPVLVVDDDDLFLKYCNRILDDRSFAVDMAEDGFEALEKVQQRDYAVILLDVSMPNMDGITCLKRLRERGCGAVIIMVTGGGDVPTAVEAMKRGAVDYIEKPFCSDSLLSRIGEALSKRKQAQDADSGELSREPVVAYIQQHAAQVNSRQDVAEAMGLSLDQVSARIQVATSVSFRQLLHTCRLKTAMQLLETTEIEIARIASRTGFATVQHFSRVFSNICGVSPRKYRQQSRLGDPPSAL